MEFFRKYGTVILWTVLIVSVVVAVELYIGRSVFGPDGKFGWWEGSATSSENSQRVADAYTFSHVIHGMVFYAFLWLIARRVPVKYRFVLALLMEAAWELFENSPFIINRYREGTIALGYIGDSILNSVSDIAMAGIGFLIARFFKTWMIVALILIMEVGCLFWIRDNLTLNIIMLVHPVESIRVWQSTGK